MKLCTFSPLPSGDPRPGLVVGNDDRIIDIPAALGASDDTRTMLGVIRAGAAMLARLKALEAKAGVATVDLANVKLHAPIPRTAKNVFAIGWNYLPHFEEGVKSGLLTEDDWQRYIDTPPPSHVAPIVAWLCTSAADAVTGEVFGAMGGRISRWSHMTDAASIYRGHHGTTPPWQLDEIDALTNNLLAPG